MTYSIVAHDSQTGELGIAVQSRFFAAGRMVPWAEAGVGVIASQAFANPAYGSEGLQLLRAGLTPEEALNKLVSEDPGAATRQVAILDAQGRVAVYTGALCVAAAGHAIGKHCSAQANMMAQHTVWQAMAGAFERASGHIAERMVAAMEAAEREGGDLRGKQAAALIVVSARPPNTVKGGRMVDLRIDDHPDPVGEIKRLLSYNRAHQRAGQAIDKAFAGDFTGALSDLDFCCAAYPNEPEFLIRRAILLLAGGRMEEARELVQRACGVHPGWAEFLRRFAGTGTLPITPEQVAPLIAGLTRDR